ncbi:energy-coupling factor transport system ATP-binding protein [Mycoplasmopsis mustelae]|uniref:Energy-coupling factor transporter ATP-binding protein EcfA2 n=1 Tax=Mycoplasmopsis mustelae TaxID=171289 RepID=A0A4R7UEU0_9BACT|nr:energy-coupling factor transporter ATPase [Mycoplasmopsis mustelae]TDV24403.1 energy-coupling factor transport system ATP-binding protein [Mycoplasmopsis mustelae]
MQIKTNHISHTFSKKTPWEFTALTNINLEIKQGEYLGIIGSTGSGKTTLIEHLNGLLKPTTGSIEWHFSADIYNKKTKQNISTQFDLINNAEKRRKLKNTKEIRKKIGIVFQFAEYQLFKNTIKDDIAFGPIAYDVPKQEAYQRAKECLKMVGLSEEYLERSPFELSGGQKRRVAVAGILAMQPDFMVFDEPTAGLDPVGVVEILDILSNLNKAGKTIINVTHDLDHVLEHASRVIILKDGKLVQSGKPYDVLNNIELLWENNLQPPKLLEFVYKLRQKGLNVPEVRSLQELSDYINNLQKGK